jgi:hypothetical protein
MSPAQRSKRLMESEGYTVDVVEHWNAFAHKRFDLFGFLDLLCVKDKVVGVQTTTASNMSARRKKIREHVNYLAVEGAGIRVELHGWHKVNNRWQVKREVIT